MGGGVAQLVERWPEEAYQAPVCLCVCLINSNSKAASRPSWHPRVCGRKNEHWSSSGRLVSRAKTAHCMAQKYSQFVYACYLKFSSYREKPWFFKFLIFRMFPSVLDQDLNECKFLASNTSEFCYVSRPDDSLILVRSSQIHKNNRRFKFQLWLKGV